MLFNETLHLSLFRQTLNFLISYTSQIATKSTTISLEKIVPYDKNPRNAEAAVDAVAESIREFGFQQPIVVDKDFVIIAGHARYFAAVRLGIDHVSVHVAKELSSKQVRDFRLAENKTAARTYELQTA